MKNIFVQILVTGIIMMIRFTFSKWSKQEKPPKLLVFSNAAGYRHQSIEAGKKVYHSDLYCKEIRYSNYYDGKMLIYERMRGWLKAVSIKPNGDYSGMEPFVPNISAAAPIDIKVGPAGKLLRPRGTVKFDNIDSSGVTGVNLNTVSPGNETYYALCCGNRA